MANRKRGEVELEAGDEVFFLKLSTNAICSLEDELNMSISEIGDLFGEDKSDFRVGTFRTIVRACLTEPVTKEKAGDIIDLVGLTEVALALSKAFAAAFPPAPESAGGNGEAAKSGTGKSS